MSGNNSKFISIAIDGPASAGKSTLAKGLAKKLGFEYLNTGALYRACAVYVMESGIECGETAKIEELFSRGGVEVHVNYINGEQRTYLNGRDITVQIAGNDGLSIPSSTVSNIQKVRGFLMRPQREAAELNNITMEGRDIGTVILPDADVKIYLTAAPEKRAERRHEEKPGKTYGTVLREINERDAQDAAKMVPAADAVVLDNTNYGFEETLAEALKIVKEKLPDVCIR